MVLEKGKEDNRIIKVGKRIKTGQLKRCLKCLIAVLILGILPLFSVAEQNFEPNMKAEAGIMDLTQLDFQNDVASLDGQWEFYWNQLLNPGEVAPNLITGYVDVPRSWNKYEANKSTYSGDGYATYRLTFSIDDNRRLALKIPRLRTAYKLWGNGELIASAGTVGKTRDTMKPQYLPQISFFDAKAGDNEILIQVSNFYHRSGGISESLKLGSEGQIVGLKLRNTAMEFILFGSLMVIGAYHLVLFFFRKKKDGSPLYFGLFCALIGIRTLLGGECFLFYLMPEFNWEIAHKILTLTYYLGVPLALMFLRSIFPKYFNIRMIRGAQIMGGIFVLILLFTPARIFTVINIVYQIWSFAVIFYIVGALVRIFIHREKGGWLIGTGAIALLIGGINDIIFFTPCIYENKFIFLGNLVRVGNLTPLGLFIFACTNSLLIAKRFSDALEQKEIMTVKLVEVNAHLDELVNQRTKDLAESNRKIESQNLELERRNQTLQKLSFRDPLIGIWNRRKYDQMIDQEWRRCLREQRPMAILFLDIDYFKRFNDFYGHKEGDECLIKVGQALRNSLSRSTDMLARYGGEELIVLLPGSSKEEAIKTADMLRKRVENLAIPHENSPTGDYVTVSIGCTSAVPAMNSSYQDLFNIADEALYQAKNAGRNQVKFL
ncbi:MAG: diguanylate cyclase [Muricomes sp.]